MPLYKFHDVVNLIENDKEKEFAHFRPRISAAERRALSDRVSIVLILMTGVKLLHLPLRRRERAVSKVSVLEGVHCNLNLTISS